MNMEEEKKMCDQCDCSKTLSLWQVCDICEDENEYSLAMMEFQTNKSPLKMEDRRSSAKKPVKTTKQLSQIFQESTLKLPIKSEDLPVKPVLKTAQEIYDSIDHKAEDEAQLKQAQQRAYACRLF